MFIYSSSQVKKQVNHINQSFNAIFIKPGKHRVSNKQIMNQ